MTTVTTATSSTSALLNLLQGEPSKTTQYKSGATLLFREHVISIVKYPINANEAVYDMIDSLPTYEGSGSRTRCHSLDALKVHLEYYSTCKFSKSNIEHIECNLWDNAIAEFDPRVFQSFIWTDVPKPPPLPPPQRKTATFQQGVDDNDSDDDSDDDNTNEDDLDVDADEDNGDDDNDSDDNNNANSSSPSTNQFTNEDVLSDYELLRLKNIQRNQERFKKLGLDKFNACPSTPTQQTKKKKTNKKRKGVPAAPIIIQTRSAKKRLAEFLIEAIATEGENNEDGQAQCAGNINDHKGPVQGSDKNGTNILTFMASPPPRNHEMPTSDENKDLGLCIDFPQVEDDDTGGRRRRRSTRSWVSYTEVDEDDVRNDYSDEEEIRQARKRVGNSINLKSKKQKRNIASSDDEEFKPAASSKKAKEKTSKEPNDSRSDVNGGTIQRIRTPTPQDVLCGLGTRLYSHPGNKVFREWVRVRKDFHHRNYHEKTNVAKEIVSQVQDQNGRFLTKDTSVHGGSNDHWWIEADYTKALEKTKNCLRRMAHQLDNEDDEDNDGNFDNDLDFDDNQANDNNNNDQASGSSSSVEPHESMGGTRLRVDPTLLTDEEAPVHELIPNFGVHGCAVVEVEEFCLPPLGMILNEAADWIVDDSSSNDGVGFGDDNYYDESSVRDNDNKKGPYIHPDLIIAIMGSSPQNNHKIPTSDNNNEDDLGVSTDFPQEVGDEEVEVEEVEDEEYELIHVCTTEELEDDNPVICYKSKCNLVACSVWHSLETGNIRDYCIDCQRKDHLSDYDDWPLIDELPIDTITYQQRELMTEKCTKKNHQAPPLYPFLIIPSLTFGSKFDDGEEDVDIEDHEEQDDDAEGDGDDASDEESIDYGSCALFLPFDMNTNKLAVLTDNYEEGMDNTNIIMKRICKRTYFEQYNKERSLYDDDIEDDDSTVESESDDSEFDPTNRDDNFYCPSLGEDKKDDEEIRKLPTHYKTDTKGRKPCHGHGLGGRWRGPRLIKTKTDKDGKIITNGNGQPIVENIQVLDHKQWEEILGVDEAELDSGGNWYSRRYSRTYSCFYEKKDLTKVYQNLINSGYHYKICTRCETAKPIVKYNKSIRKVDGLVPICKECVNENSRMSNSGVSNLDYDFVKTIQDGKCMVCKQPETFTKLEYCLRWDKKSSRYKIITREVNIELAWDHNHITGALRSLCCSNCNLILERSVKWITPVKKYLDFHDKRNPNNKRYDCRGGSKRRQIRMGK